MSKFKHCHVSNGLMWCRFTNGKWARPWPVGEDNASSEEKENTSVDTDVDSDKTN